MRGDLDAKDPPELLLLHPGVQVQHLLVHLLARARRRRRRRRLMMKMMKMMRMMMLTVVTAPTRMTAHTGRFTLSSIRWLTIAHSPGFRH